ncbi:MAG: hypothetical protein ACRD1T_00925 [Acidimicrobiia bacterium]
MRSTGLPVRRISGALLVAGFAFLVPGVTLPSRQTGTTYFPPTFSTRAGATLLFTISEKNGVGIWSLTATL